jgi:hypothetical protein
MEREREKKKLSRGIDVKDGTAGLYGDRLKNVFGRTDN